MVLEGQRKTLISRINASFVGSAGLGVVDASGFARLVGIFSNVGSLTLQYRMGVASGAYAVTSSVAVNSGGATLDVINYGGVIDFALTAINSQSNVSFAIYGEAVR